MEDEKVDYGKTMSGPPLTLKEMFKGETRVDIFAKLPEWDGFWLKWEDNVFVFTRDNELLNSPDYNTFGHRNDWGTVEVNAPYRFALAKRFIKSNRVRLDEILTRINHVPGNRETSEAKTSVQLAFMFLGLELAYLGSENPYPESMNANNNIIENPQDKWDGEKSVLITLTMDAPSEDINSGISYTKWLRQELQYSQDLIKAYMQMIRPSSDRYVHSRSINMDTVIVRITEGKLWLGQQLNNYHEEQKKKDQESEKIRAKKALQGTEVPDRRLQE